MTETLARAGEKAVDYVHFRPEFAARLIEDYGQEKDQETGQAKIMMELDNWESAPLAHQPGQSINYVRLNPSVSGAQGLENGRRLLVIPGHDGTIQSLSPFAATMATRGYDVTLAHENLVGLVNDGSGEPLAARNQALNLAAIIVKEGLQNEPIDIVGHSYAAPVTEQLVKIAKAKNWTCFEGASIALVAPVEIHQEPQLDRLRSKVLSKLRKLHRKLVPVEGIDTLQTFDDDYREHHADADEAAAKIRRSNRRRSRLEAREVRTRTIDLEELAAEVGRLALFPLAGDEAFSDEFYAEPSTRDRFEKLHNVTVLTPISPRLLTEDQPSEGIRGALGSDHCAILWHPETVADPVDAFLRPKEHAIDPRTQRTVPLYGIDLYSPDLELAA